MKKLYLHIGCGKTGSSALQIWLHQNADNFLKLGIFYPTLNQKIKTDYQITSGNGVALSRDLIEKKSIDIIEESFSSGIGSVLFSSENFQKLEKVDIQNLLSECLRNNIEVHVLAFVRDVYDIVFSSYMQSVKRGNYYKTFREYADGVKSLQQFEVVRKWAEFFPDIKVVHYDAFKNKVNVPFLEWLGVDSKAIPEIKKTKVNRSLTLLEAEFLRLLNKVYCEKFNNLDFSFSSRISDAIILNDPEKKSEILLDVSVLKDLESRFSEFVDEFNVKYLEAQGDGIKIFNKEGKHVVEGVPNLEDFLFPAIRALALITQSIETKGAADKIIDSALGIKKEDSSSALKINDPRIVDVIRNQAVKMESENIIYSYILMLAAGILRPNGVVIKNKIKAYKEKIGKNKNLSKKDLI